SVARQHTVDLVFSDTRISDRLPGGVGSEPKRAAAGHFAHWRHPDADDGDLAAKGVAAHEAALARRASSSWRWTLPLVERGKSPKSMKRNCRGLLYPASSRRQISTSSASVTLPSRHEMNATGTSPHFASGARTTAASVMRLSASSTRSISAG